MSLAQGTGESAPSYRRNYGVLVGDVTFFFIAVSFLDSTVVLPALVHALGGNAFVLGVFAAAKQAGLLAPQLIAAHRLQGRQRYLPFLLKAAFCGRVGLFVAAAVLLVWGGDEPVAALIVLGVVYTGMWAGDGLGVVAWTALIGRVIPGDRRGGFFAVTQVFSGLARIGVGLFVRWALAPSGPGFPASGALLALLAGVSMMISWACIALVREPTGGVLAETSRQPFARYVAALPQAVRTRPAFGRLAAVQVLSTAVFAASPFYLGHARASLPALRSGVEGEFLIVLTVGGLACAPLWGALTDRRGPRASLLAMLSLSLVSPLLIGIGGGAASLPCFYLAFFFLGGVTEGGWTIFTNYLLETIPADEQPTYIGLFSVLGVPALVLPLLAGALVSTVGTPVLLGAVTTLLIAGLALGVTLPHTRRGVKYDY